MRKLRIPLTAGTVLLTAALLAAGTSALGASGGRAVRGTVYAALTHTVKSTAYAAGNSSDNVLGQGAVTFTIKIVSTLKPGTLKGSGPVTAYTKTGSLSGGSSELETIGKNGTVTLTDGKLDLTHGFGGEAGHSFVGTFTGTGSSSTGPYVFHYKGTYK